MGSALSGLASTPQIEFFFGPSSIANLDKKEQLQYWDALLDLQVENSSELAEAIPIASLKASFGQNDESSNNYSSLIAQTTHLLYCASAKHAYQMNKTLIAVFLLRLLTQWLIERDTPKILSKLCVTRDFVDKNVLTLKPNAKPVKPSKGNGNGMVDLAEDLVIAATEFLIEKDINPDTVAIHEEVLKLIITLLSSQLGRTGDDTEVKDDDLFFRAFLNSPSVRHVQLVETLVLHYIVQRHPSTGVGSYYDYMNTLGYAAVALVFLPITLPSKWIHGVYKYFFIKGGETPEGDTLNMPMNWTLGQPPQGDFAMLILLILANTTNDNPYKRILGDMNDLASNKDEDEEDKVDSKTFALPYKRILVELSKRITQDEHSIIFLYHLINDNALFRDYVSWHVDLDTIIMPMLELLYNAKKHNPRTIHLVLVILLMLTQDKTFTENAQKLMKDSVPWYKDARVTNISLGGIITLVLVHMINFSITKLKSTFMHSYCLAILGNMSAHVVNLHTHVSFRMLQLLNMLSIKYQALLKKRQDVSGEERNHMVTMSAQPMKII